MLDAAMVIPDEIPVTLIGPIAGMMATHFRAQRLALVRRATGECGLERRALLAQSEYCADQALIWDNLGQQER